MNRLLEHKLELTKKNNQQNSGFLSPESHLWVLNPIWQTALWIAALFWGATASLFANEIMSFSWPIPPNWDLRPNYYTVIFFLTAVVLAFGFALSSWVARAQDSVVVESMLTMPPHDFWSSYGENFAIASQMVDNRSTSMFDGLEKHQNSPAELDALRKDLEKDARTILDSIINLVKKWDSSNLRGSSVIYRANLMKVYYFGNGEDCINSDSDIAKQLNEHGRHFTVQPFSSHYSGFVVLENNIYTTTTETSSPDPDSDRKAIAFPFTDLVNDLEYPIYSNLFGAPKAVISRSASYVPDVKDIINDYTKNSSVVDRDILEQLNEYYSDTSVAHSILSIPVRNNDTLKVSFVLNIYRNQNGLLFDGSKVKDFVEIIRPFTTTLARLLETGELFDQLRRQP
ncbi:hypothetical protein C4D04_RS06580 [Vibrio parahaemolyticus]|nr:hypothetical protein [Vibrio parahaemolyticus]EJG0560972.1 hypothetical protein [Vibrio parahaemolyticus]EJG0571282.1 hypothetical protein [Vibrio parahaemolyticus]